MNAQPFEDIPVQQVGQTVGEQAPVLIIPPTLHPSIFLMRNERSFWHYFNNSPDAVFAYRTKMAPSWTPLPTITIPVLAYDWGFVLFLIILLVLHGKIRKWHSR